MRRMWLAGGGAVAILAGAVALGQVVAPSLPAASDVTVPADAMPALARAYVADGKAPGIVIAYAKDDGPPMFASAGMIADGNAPKADADTLWRVYSMTKPITGMAAMMLIEDGKLKLDQPVGDFIPGFKTMRVLTDPDNGLATRPAAGPVTVRHLLTHSAGLGYTITTRGPLLKEYERLGIIPFALNPPMEPEYRKVRPGSLKEFADRVATLPLIADPGTKWSYSIGLDVLARVIEVAGGMPFEKFLQVRLFDPLGMKSTYWTVPASETGRLATSYVWAGENRVPIDPGERSVFSAPPSFPYGGAGLVMSARDYDRFLRMLAGEGRIDGVRVMKRSTVRLGMSNLLPKEVTLPDNGGAAIGYGAGGYVNLSGVPGGPGKGSFGWSGAAGTSGWVDPEHKVRVTAMVNYMPPERWPLRADAIRAVYADLAR